MLTTGNNFTFSPACGVRGVLNFLVKQRRVASYRRGVTLVEVLVASVVMAMLAVSVSSLLLSTFRASKTGQARHEVNLEAMSLKEHLKSYMTADTSVLANAPGRPPWHLPGDSSCNDCWALAPGVHDATSHLPMSFREKYKATMNYTVKSENYRGRAVSSVNIAIDWNAP